MKCSYLIILMLIIGGCNSGDKNNAAVAPPEIDAIDSSAIINNATILPADSTNMGVTH